VGFPVGLFLEFNSRNWLRQDINKRSLAMLWTKIIDALVESIEYNRDDEYNA
jgi:hypothetical protein